MKFEKKIYKRNFELKEKDKKLRQIVVNKVEDLLELDSDKILFRNSFLLVGGFIRDRIINIDISDYDFVLPTKIYKKVINILEKYQTLLQIHIFETKDTENKKFNLKTFIFKGKKVQIKEIKWDLKKDFEFRDFTINCLLYNLYTDQIFDFCNGMDDLLNEKVICVNRDIKKNFCDSFERFFRLPRFLINFGGEKELIIYIIRFFKNENNYLKIISDENKLKKIKFELKKVFLYNNTGEIIKIMMDLGIFNFFYNKKFLDVEPEKIKPLYSSILQLIKKIDIFFKNENLLKLKFGLSDKDFKLNVYSLKTNAIIYCFYHPKFTKGKLKESQRNKFNFTRYFTPDEFFLWSYEIEKLFIEKKFTEEYFDVFDSKVKALKCKSNKPICKLLTILPLLNHFENSIISKDFIEIVRTLEFRNGTKNIKQNQNNFNHNQENSFLVNMNKIKDIIKFNK